MAVDEVVGRMLQGVVVKCLDNQQEVLLLELVY